MDKKKLIIISAFIGIIIALFLFINSSVGTNLRLSNIPKEHYFEGDSTVTVECSYDGNFIFIDLDADNLGNLDYYRFARGLFPDNRYIEIFFLDSKGRELASKKITSEYIEINEDGDGSGPFDHQASAKGRLAISNKIAKRISSIDVEMSMIFYQK